MVLANSTTRKLAVLRALAICLVLSAVVSTGAFAQALERDRVFGDTFEVLWSPGNWTQNGNPLPACETFTGGTSTGPGQTSDADSVICPVTANGWNWTVTVPGPYTINWGMGNFPPGIEVCAQIFYVVNRSGVLNVDVDLGHDWMTVSDEDGQIYYEGSYSGFFPGREGFVVTEARRCGLIRILPLGACCFPDGHCEYVYEQGCLEAEGDWLGENTTCDPNPCPPPPPLGACCLEDGSCQVVEAAVCQDLGGVYQGDNTVCEPNPCPPVPVEESTWGRVKAIYR